MGTAVGEGCDWGKTPALNRNGWLRAPPLAAAAKNPASVGGRGSVRPAG